MRVSEERDVTLLDQIEDSKLKELKHNYGLIVDEHYKTKQYEEWFLLEKHLGSTKEITVSISLENDGTLLLYGDVSVWGELGFLDKDEILQLLTILLSKEEIQKIKKQSLNVDYSNENIEY